MSSSSSLFRAQPLVGGVGLDRAPRLVPRAGSLCPRPGVGAPQRSTVPATVPNTAVLSEGGSPSGPRPPPHLVQSGAAACCIGQGAPSARRQAARSSSPHRPPEPGRPIQQTSPRLRGPGACRLRSAVEWDRRGARGCWARLGGWGFGSANRRALPREAAKGFCGELLGWTFRGRRTGAEESCATARLPRACLTPPYASGGLGAVSSMRGRAHFQTAFSLIERRQWGRWKAWLRPYSRATDFMGRARWVPGDPDPSWRGWIVIEHDPKLFQWKHPSGGYRATGEGILSCTPCVTRRSHTLDWPADAWPEP